VRDDEDVEPLNPTRPDERTARLLAQLEASLAAGLLVTAASFAAVMALLGLVPGYLHIPANPSPAFLLGDFGVMLVLACDAVALLSGSWSLRPLRGQTMASAAGAVGLLVGLLYLGLSIFVLAMIANPPAGMDRLGLHIPLTALVLSAATATVHLV